MLSQAPLLHRETAQGLDNLQKIIYKSTFQ